MKMRLLKRLRRKYAKKYCITKAGNGCWKVWYGNTDTSYWMVFSIEKAQEKIKNAIWGNISEELTKIRRKQGRSHGIKYYPWVILLFFVISVNAQTKQQVLAEIKRQNIPHPEIVLAQARLESGNFKAKTYLNTGNLLGIKKNGRYVVYPGRNWRECIRDYKKEISSRYIKEGRWDYYEFLKRMEYAKDPKYINKLKACVK